MRLTTKILLLWIVLVGGCDRSTPTSAPANLAATPRGTAVVQSAAAPFSGVTVSEQAPVVAIPEQQAQPSVPDFSDYAETLRRVRQVATPQIVSGPDGMPDPGSINAYANDLGARVQGLNQQRQAIENSLSLSPAQKQQWDAYRKSLESGQ